MNRIVSIIEVGGLQLRIKDANTNATLGLIKSSNWTADVNNPQVMFNLGNKNNKTDIAGKLTVGSFYKIQLAYFDQTANENIGYFSTICIIKFTTKPNVSIANFSRYVTNVDTVEYTGVYNNITDTSEKAYQYMFVLRDSHQNVLESSGWLTHNSNEDAELGQSKDTYNILYAILPNEKYTMQYSVLTNNNLRCDSPRYQIVGAVSIAPDLDADLYMTLDYDNGCVKLLLKEKIMPKDKITGISQAPNLSGSFILTRSSAAENYAVWTRLYAFTLTGQIPEETIFTDYTIEQGQIYKYAIQQYNYHGVFSNKLYAIEQVYDSEDKLVPTENEEIKAAFEDMFLCDGDRQLRVRFNPKVTSFKTVLTENKKTTLGSKYPFFFRNGITEYKEFPVSGLISYLEDENQLFMSKVNDIGMPADWQDTTNITDDNLTYERRFKLEVLNWLNDGKVKLFRSPSEGNYLVRLMNVQITPNDTLSRMIHTFSCTATEIDDCTASKLQYYGFLQSDVTIPMHIRFGTIRLAELYEDMLRKMDNNIEQTNEVIQRYDLLSNFPCQYLKIEECLPQTEFELGGDSFQIGATGTYEATFTDNPHSLFLKTPTRHMSGIVTYGILTSISNVFDTITGITQRDVLRFYTTYSGNFIEDVTSSKEHINKIYFMHFSLNDLSYTFNTIEEYYNHYGVYFADENEWQYGKDKDGYTIPLKGYANITDQPKFLPECYYMRPMDNTDTFAYEYTNRNGLDLYVDGSIIYIMSTGDIYKYQVDISKDIWVGRLTLIGTANDSLGATQIRIDDDLIDIALTREVYFPLSESVPKVLEWGSSVCAELCYQLITIDYGTEHNTKMLPGDSYTMDTYRSYIDLLHKNYDAEILQYKRMYGNTNLAALKEVKADDEQAYYTWKEFDKFYRLEEEDRLSYTGEEYWVPMTQWKHPEDLDYCVFDSNIDTDLKLFTMSPPDQGNTAISRFYPVARVQYNEKVSSLLTEQEKEIDLNEQ